MKETSCGENIFVFLMAWALQPLEPEALLFSIVLKDRRWRNLIFLDPSNTRHKISTLLVSV